MLDTKTARGKSP
jgi:hypothetical protein